MASQTRDCMNNAMKAKTAAPGLHQRAGHGDDESTSALLRPEASLRTRSRGIAPQAPLPRRVPPKPELTIELYSSPGHPGISAIELHLQENASRYASFISRIAKASKPCTKSHGSQSYKQYSSESSFCSKHPASEPAASPEKPLRLILRVT